MISSWFSHTKSNSLGSCSIDFAFGGGWSPAGHIFHYYTIHCTRPVSGYRDMLYMVYQCNLDCEAGCQEKHLHASARCGVVLQVADSRVCGDRLLLNRIS